MGLERFGERARALVAHLVVVRVQRAERRLQLQRRRERERAGVAQRAAVEVEEAAAEALRAAVVVSGAEGRREPWRRRSRL